MKNLTFIASCLISMATLVFADAPEITPALPDTDDDGCYQIETADHLFGFAALVNGTLEEHDRDKTACGILVKDITINEDVLDDDGSLKADEEDLASWTPIMSFGGSFDGNGKTISGLYFKGGKKDTVGLFGSIGKDGNPTTIKNVGIKDSYFESEHISGGIVGIVRSDANAVIFNSYNEGTVVGDTAAGILGIVKSGTVHIYNTYNIGAVNGSKVAAGIIAAAGGKISVTNTYNLGDISGKNLINGIVAHAKGESTFSIKNSFFLDSLKVKNDDTTPKGATKASQAEFENGTVLLALKNYKDDKVDGSVWGQTVKKGSHPDLSGKIKNLTLANYTLVITKGDTVKNQYIVGIKTDLPTPSRQGFTFKGWFDNAKFKGDTITSISKKDTADLTFYAKWEEILCKLTLSVNDTTMGSVSGAGKYSCGEEVTIEATAFEGYYFKEWNDGSTKASRTVKVKADTSFKATFKPTSSSSAKSSSSKGKSSSSSKGKSSSSSKGKSSSSSKGKSSSSSKKVSSSSVSSSSSSETFNFSLVKVTPKEPEKDNGCYQIGSVEELYGFAAIVNGTDSMTRDSAACGKLIDNITINEDLLKDNGRLNTQKTEIKPWTPINNFAGIFDGNKKKISGLFFKDSANAIGLFGSVVGGTKKDPVVIKDLGLVDSYIDGYTYVGGIVGEATAANLSMTGVYNTSTIVGYNNVGGLLGSGIVDPDQDTLSKYTLTITNCFNSGIVSAMFTGGGIAGVAGEVVTITNSYNFGKVSGSEHADALIGAHYNGIQISIRNTFYPEGVTSRYGGDPADKKDFENGTVLKKLQDYKVGDIDGSIWGKAKDSKLPALTYEPKKDNEDAIAGTRPFQQFFVLTSGHTVSINGVQAGTKVVVTDMQGHLIAKETATGHGLSIGIPHTGAYIIRAGNQVNMVTIK
ncbi:MAG: InlB B-repeat-containing protein [Fibrobacter sp.]|nr:InlB B-repeat-containing protein [Fibrobacter sp.]